MRLFHVSEEPDIVQFIPRLPTRTDLDPKKGLVWALCERTLPNFLTPRNCPRVCWHVGPQTTKEDCARYLPADRPDVNHVVAIEAGWLPALMQTTLYLYEFAPDNFVLQDEHAGYYISEKAETPVAKTMITDLCGELAKRGVLLKTVDNLWEIGSRIQKTSFYWSLCRMAFAKKP